MRLPQTLLFLLGFFTTIHALALPEAFTSFAESAQSLYKRKGGGSGGGKSGGSTGSSGGSSSGSKGSNGGSTSSGTGTRSSPSYGGGRYYGGGAAAPYSAGGRSPGGVTPYLLGGAALAVLPGIWLYGAYAYPYSGYHTYHNNTNNQNETTPVECVCAQYSQCGCDNNTDSDYLTGVANNQSVSRVANLNGTDTLVVNGTLDNDTSTTSGAAGGARQGLLENSGFWMVIAGVGYTMWFM